MEATEAAKDFSSLFSTFHETPIHLFRSKLAATLRKIVEAASHDTSGPFVRYDSESLIDSLQALDWNAFCKDFDESCPSKQKSEKDTRVQQDLPSYENISNPLSELLDAFSNPTIWPPACLESVVGVLVTAFIFYNASKKTGRKRSYSPSQQLLLRQSTWMLIQFPSLRLVLFDSLSTSLLAILFQSISEPHQAQRAISLLKYWIRELDEEHLASWRWVLWICCFSSKLDILLNVGQAHLRQQQQQQQQQKRPSEDVTLSVSQSSPVPRQSRALRQCYSEQIEYLHGDLSTEDEEAYCRRLQRAQPRWAPRCFWSMKEVMMAPSDTVQSQRQRLSELEQTRLKCFRVLASLLPSLRDLSAGAPRLLPLLVTMETLDSSHGVSVRFATLLLLEDSRDAARDWLVYVNLIWSWTTASARNAQETTRGLYLFAESLVESQQGDNLEVLWEAVLLLLEQVQAVATVRNAHYLHCLGYILTRRGNLLARHVDFPGIMAHLSQCFDCVDHWWCPTMATTLPVQRPDVLNALQVAGVLGWTALEEYHASRGKDKTDGKEDDRATPVSSPQTLRRLAERVQLSLQRPEPILSCHSPQNEVPPAYKPKNTPSRRRVNPPLPRDTSDKMHDDVLNHMFGFLGYKRLVRMRLVCRQYKALADGDALWEPLYKKRFGCEPDDPALLSTTQQPWRDLFRDRWQAHREIRFREHTKTSFAWRLCKYLACEHKVLTTPLRWQQHYTKHQRALDRQKSSATTSSSTKTAPSKKRKRKETTRVTTS